MLAVVALLVSACGGAPGSTFASAGSGSGSPSAAAATATSLRLPAAVPSPAPNASTAATESCGATGTFREVVRLGHTFNYRRVLPGLGFLPQFDVLTGPAWLVVYTGQSPLRPPYVPIYPPTTAPGWTPAPEPTLAPGSSDVCLAVDGIAEPFIETYVPTTEIHPEFADDERQPPVAGEGRVVGRLDAATWSLAWDPGRHVLWYVTLAGSASRLHRLDPATGVSASWRLPAGLGLEKSTDTGFVEQVAVDASGGVWFEANGYILYRFDPDTATFLRTKLLLKEPGVHWQDGGTWVSAILPYGKGVLVARNRVPWLTRYDAQHAGGRDDPVADWLCGAAGTCPGRITPRHRGSVRDRAVRHPRQTRAPAAVRAMGRGLAGRRHAVLRGRSPARGDLAGRRSRAARCQRQPRQDGAGQARSPAADRAGAPTAAERRDRQAPSPPTGTAAGGTSSTASRSRSTPVEPRAGSRAPRAARGRRGRRRAGIGACRPRLELERRVRGARPRGDSERVALRQREAHTVTASVVAFQPPCD